MPNKLLTERRTVETALAGDFQPKAVKSARSSFGFRFKNWNSQWRKQESGIESVRIEEVDESFKE